MSENEGQPNQQYPTQPHPAQPPGSEWARPTSSPAGSNAPGTDPPPGQPSTTHGSAAQGQPGSSQTGSSQPQPYGSPYQQAYGQSSPGQAYGWTQTLQMPGAAPPPSAANGPAPRPQRPPGSAAKIAIGAVAALAIAVGAGGVGGFVGYALHPDSSPLQMVQEAPENAAPVIDRSSLASIAAAIQPAVVSIASNAGNGSGVIISEDGYIVTNNHVVGNSRNVRVTFNSGRSMTVPVIGTDEKTDLAVLKADATGLRFASWGNSDDVQVGDTVLAIGSPLGLDGSVTAGIVSAKHRTITVGEENIFQPGPITTIGDAIQTDAPINPGNSGGALVNTEGQLIGINTAIATSGSRGNIGVGFAISSNRAKTVTDQIIRGEPVSHPYLGVSIGNAEDGGAQIQQVQPGSPADQAGLQVGDVVTRVNDRPITGSEALVGAIQSSTVGETLTLTVIRNGTERTVTATVGEQP